MVIVLNECFSSTRIALVKNLGKLLTDYTSQAERDQHTNKNAARFILYNKRPLYLFNISQNIKKVDAYNGKGYNTTFSVMSADSDLNEQILDEFQRQTRAVLFEPPEQVCVRLHEMNKEGFLGFEANPEGVLAAIRGRGFA
jgi:hypothetical protein